MIANKSWIWANWPASEHVRAGTSIRTGGFSHGHFSGLNLATHVGDDKNAVLKNRAFLAQQLCLSSGPNWLNQIHSNYIIDLEIKSENMTADGACSINKNQICAILTADCVPLLFCNKAGTKIAAIHAGWKGLCGGIVENACRLFPSPSEVMVWIGPCICQKHYEVGNDVYQSCIEHLQATQDAFTQIDTEHWQCDLVSIAKIILKNSHIGAIYECGLCTYEEEELFYSYRRESITGRTASMIWMD